MIRTTTITATPTMCHHAEKALSTAVIDTLNMLISPEPSMIIPYVK